MRSKLEIVQNILKIQQKNYDVFSTFYRQEVTDSTVSAFTKIVLKLVPEELYLTHVTQSDS